MCRGVVGSGNLGSNGVVPTLRGGGETVRVVRELDHGAGPLLDSGTY